MPEWVEWTVARIDSMDAFELAAVVPAGRARRDAAAARGRPPHLAYRLYEWLDRRVFGRQRPCATPTCQRIPPGAMTRGCRHARRGRVVPAGRPDDLGGPTPRHGVWAIAPMDDGRPTSAPSRFWEVRGRTGTATTAVVSVGDGVTRVIARGSARADPLSLTRTRDAAAWTSARLVLRCLRSLHRDGDCVPARTDRADAEGLPPPAATVMPCGAHGAAGRCGKEPHGLAPQRVVRRGGRTIGRRRASRAHAVLPNPAGRYLADPFPIEVDGRHFLFVEDYSHSARRAVISVSELGTDEAWSSPRTVLERDHHLSYPFVFEHEGAIYMLPETEEAGRIELHRAVEFPYDWRLDRVLLDGLTALDATLHAEDGLLWLFANIIGGARRRG